MVKFAVDFASPIAVRYPRGEAYDGLEVYREPIVYGKSEWIYKESEIVLFALGSMVKTAEFVRDALKEQGYACSLINARFAKPLDTEALDAAAENHKLIVTMEENVINGSMGEHVTEYYQQTEQREIRVLNIAIPDDYVEHGNVDILRKEVGIDAESIVNRTIQAYEKSIVTKSGVYSNEKEEL